MTRRSQVKKVVRKWYSKDFKDESLAVAKKFKATTNPKYVCDITYLWDDEG